MPGIVLGTENKQSEYSVPISLNSHNMAQGIYRCKALFKSLCIPQKLNF